MNRNTTYIDHFQIARAFFISHGHRKVAQIGSLMDGGGRDGIHDH